MEHAFASCPLRCTDGVPDRSHGERSLWQRSRCSRSVADRLHASSRHPFNLGACRPRLVRDVVHLHWVHVLAEVGEVCWLCSHHQDHNRTSCVVPASLRRRCKAPSGCHGQCCVGGCGFRYRCAGLERVCCWSIDSVLGLRTSSGPQHVPTS